MFLNSTAPVFPKNISYKNGESGDILRILPLKNVLVPSLNLDVGATTTC